jgi:hypothetical protein
MSTIFWQRKNQSYSTSGKAALKPLKAGVRRKCWCWWPVSEETGHRRVLGSGQRQLAQHPKMHGKRLTPVFVVHSELENSEIDDADRLDVGTEVVESMDDPDENRVSFEH